MTSLYPENWQSYLSILLVFLRLLGLFLLVPGFSDKSLPMTFKVLFAMAISLTIYPIVKSHVEIESLDLGPLVFLALRETLIGLLMGFVVTITFAGVEMGAQVVGLQMGLGTASLMDPINHSSVSTIVPLYSFILIALFFITNTHHQVLNLFVESFKFTENFTLESFGTEIQLKVMIEMTANLFILGIKLAAPFIFIILCCNTVIGVLARLIPQMNVLLFSFPITILISLMGFYLLAPEIIDLLEEALGKISQNVIAMMTRI